MKRALFVVDDRPEAGRGHVVRCGALADELRGRGWDAAFMSRDAIGNADVIVVDHPQEIDLYLGRARVVEIVDVPALSHADLVVCGSAGLGPHDFENCGAVRVLAGPEYSLLRPEFRARREQLEACLAHASFVTPMAIDMREWSSLSAEQMASQLFCAVAHDDEIVTYGGMRAMEAACVMGAATRGRLTIHPRNEGERLNAAGLSAGAVVDGLGCQRVADAIEALVS